MFIVSFEDLVNYKLSILSPVSVLLLLVRVVIFGVVWLLTWGKLSFWLLPNLTEDVGFLDSFRPVYQCSYASKSESGAEDAAVGDGDTDKNAEPAEDADGEEKSEDHVEELEGDDDYNEDGEDDENQAVEEGNGNDDAETSSDDDAAEAEEPSVGANDNGYEMVSAEDIDAGEAAENVDDEDLEEPRPTIRRRKGKRRTT